MESASCEPLGDLLRGRRVVLLAATDAEAEPLRAALHGEVAHVVATKRLHLGSIRRAAPGVAAGEAAGAAVRMSAGAAGDAAGIPVVVGITGCDKANAAHLLTCLLEAMAPPPVLVLQVGIAGAFAAEGPDTAGMRGATGGERGPARVGDVVIATSEAYADTGSTSPDGWLSAAELGLPIARPAGIELGGVFPVDRTLAEAAGDVVAAVGAGARSGPRVLLGPCVTLSCATGVHSDAVAATRRWGALAESMEGAAAAHICALYGVPFLEVRGISNLVTDRDRSSWEVERAILVAAQAALAVVAALDRLPLAGAAD